MFGNVYKKILDKMPVGIFAFNKDKKILFTNRAFQATLPSKKTKGKLSDLLSCNNVCPKTGECPNCAIFNAMTKAVETGKEQSVETTTYAKTHSVTMHVRIIPDTENKGIYLGIMDTSIQAEEQTNYITAREVQRQLLPVGNSVAGIAYKMLVVTCFDVGGDVLDVYEYDGQAYGVIFDISGKGMPAAMLSTFVKGGFDHKQKSLAFCMTDMSQRFQNFDFDETCYITASGVRISSSEKLIRYCTAGHNAPILLKHGSSVNEIEKSAPPISTWFADYQYEENSIPYDHGDILVLLSDGVTECKNSVGELFGIERVESVLLQSRNAEEFKTNLQSALNVYSGGKTSDDVTVIAFDL